MERKKRVSIGVVLMGFFLLFVVLTGIVGLIAHEVMLREATIGMASDKEVFSVIGALHILLELGYKGGESWVSILGANAKDYIVIGLMFTGVLMFIVAGFTKNHIIYLVSMVMTGASVFMKRFPALLTEIRVLPEALRNGGTFSSFNSMRLTADLFLVLAWLLLLTVWILSFIKAGKVRKGSANPDKSLVFGFVPGLLMILSYLGLLFFEAVGVATENPELTFYVLQREYGSAWLNFPEVEIFGTLALVLRYLFLSFQFGLLILFAGLWLNRPYRRQSAEEKAAALAAETKKAEPQPAAAPYANPYGTNYNAQANAQYGQPANPQYGQPANTQYGQPFVAPFYPTYGQQANAQYGQPANPSYGQVANPQYGQQYQEPMNQYSQPYAPEYQEPMNQQYNQPFGAVYTTEPEPETAEEPLPIEAPAAAESVQAAAAESFEAVREEAAPVFAEVKEEAPQNFAEVKEEAAESFAPVQATAAESFEAVREEAAPAFEEAKAAAEEATPAFKFCPNCGYPLEGAGRFCPSCGYKLHD